MPSVAAFKLETFTEILESPPLKVLPSLADDDGYLSLFALCNKIN